MNREQWEALTDKGQWDIKVALRGPDSYFGETLKWYTTAVIRGQMQAVFRVGGSVNNNLNLVILPKSNHYSDEPISDEQQGKFAWNASHFIEHVRQAANWMDIPVLKIPRELWNKVMQHHSHSYAAKEILAHLRAKEEKTEFIDGAPISIYGSPNNAPLIKELERHYMEQLGGKYAKNTI